VKSSKEAGKGKKTDYRNKKNNDLKRWDMLTDASGGKGTLL
jgi:hypothetical protein